MRELADVNCFIEQIFRLGDADDEAGLALACEVALEQSRQLALSEGDHFVVFLVLDRLVVSHGLDASSQDQERGVDVASFLLSVSNILKY